MQKTIILVIICLFGCFLPMTTVRAQVGIVEAVKLAAKKVIKAVDLKVQRWQNEVIDLQNLQKKLENQLSKLKLQDIADWTNKQKEQYQAYFDELKRVKTILTVSAKFITLANIQKQILEEYLAAYRLFQQDSHFSASELDYMLEVYSGMINRSVESLDDIFQMMKSFSVSMTDADRLTVINNTYDNLQNILIDLREFNRRHRTVSIQRSHSATELDNVKKLYGL